MMRFYLGRMILRALFLMLALVAGFVSIFVIGVQEVGDNAGAVGAGIPVFALVYFVLVLVDVSIRQVRGAKPRPWGRVLVVATVELGIAVVSLALAFYLATFTLPSSHLPEFPYWLRYGFPLGFLVFDTLLAYLFFNFFPSCRAARGADY